MGNLCSFPILCLLNRACIDIAINATYGEGVGRKVRVNGDDCMFAGSRRLYHGWRYVTGIFGLVVNEGKTLISHRWADLNSQTYDLKKRRLVSKPVLSFLLPPSDAPGEILSSVLEGISSFKPCVRLWIVNVLMRYEISLRGFSLSGIPSSWVKLLLRRKWFRRLVLDGPATTKTSIGGSGEVFSRSNVFDRSFPVTVGPPPHARYYKVVDQCSGLLTRKHTEAWTGVKVRPPEPKLDRASFRDRQKKPYSFPRSLRFTGISVRWSFVWPTALLDMIKESYSWMLIDDHQNLISTVAESHPFLTLEYRFRITREVPVYPPPRSFLRGVTLLPGGVTT